MKALQSGLIVFLFLTWHALPAQSLRDFNEDRIAINRTALSVLGVWAVGNMVVGGIQSTRLDGRAGYFHQMNFFWNTVNLALAGSGLWQAVHSDPATFDLAKTLTEQHTIEKLLLLNTGLDIAYISTGFYLRERSLREGNHADRLAGYGDALLLQGGFLLLFDVCFYAAHALHAPLLQGFIGTLHTIPGGLALVVKF